MTRALWQPIAPRLASATDRLGEMYEQHPLKTAVVTALTLAVTWPALLLLPGLIAVDYMLQKLYNRYGAPIEVLYEDGREMLDNALRGAGLGMKETKRLLRQLGRKFREDPKGTTKAFASQAWYAATHPRKTASIAAEFVRPATRAFLDAFRFAWWIKDPSRGTPA